MTNDPTIKIVVGGGPTTGTPGPAGPAGTGVAPGGTSGQALVKASALDGDTTWVDPAPDLIGVVLDWQQANDYAPGTVVRFGTDHYFCDTLVPGGGNPPDQGGAWVPLTLPVALGDIYDKLEALAQIVGATLPP